ncbi:HD domain-containing phosphohydrolase [Agarivorans gilvus]|uniref:Two-component system response regulator n=1 Tax=Agarivorans gilvus TaxID=680279 RepID=A0ABQ1HZG6_9ALTE|nr:HD domain-containing phosphohydrolase [Agarivorans gilvus]GGB01877.1 two-component system response regulator [Agarivorans gilvus]
MISKVLLVDDEPNNLNVLKQILADKYQLLFANNGSRAIDAALKHSPDIILLDIMMPDMDGYKVCRTLKELPSTQKIPVIFVSAMSEVEDEAMGFDVGAVDYIQKPVSAPIVLRRVQTHLSLVHARELEDNQKAAMFMLGEAGHYNDTDTGAHIWRMAAYARIIAEGAGWDEELAERLEMAAPMHDTGKIGISDTILKAPRQLSPQEWVIMKTHTEIGYKILSMSKNPLFSLAAEIARYHHEKWDGSGYPKGLKGEDIPQSARIVAIADVFDALTKKRPYKDAWPIERAIATIEAEAGSHFDPNLVEIFHNSLPQILEAKQKWDLAEQSGKSCYEQIALEDMAD